MKNVFIALLFVVIFLVSGCSVGTHNEKSTKPTNHTNKASTEVPKTAADPIENPTANNPTISNPTTGKKVTASAFKNRLQEIALENNLMPATGLDAFALLDIFPGLTEVDFERVTALEGHYAISGGLAYVQGKGQPTSPTGQTLSLEGYATLLGNLAVYSAVSLGDEESLEKIISLMQSGSSKIPIQNRFPEKIVYGDNMRLRQSALKLDCSARGGTFSTCGSVCPKTADVCTDQCAYTCEFTKD